MSSRIQLMDSGYYRTWVPTSTSGCVADVTSLHGYTVVTSLHGYTVVTLVHGYTVVTLVHGYTVVTLVHGYTVIILEAQRCLYHNPHNQH